jgi:arsenite-transporting ATPase
VAAADQRGAVKMLKNNYEPFSLDGINLTKYMFFTGKGGVGKTSTACAVAVNLADNGKSVLLISTDPASNLQDVFNTELDGKGVPIDGVPGLVVANLDPEEAAREYRESVIAPYRGKLPDSVIVNMEEQLSGSCTVEIAAFDQFSNFITDKSTENKYDYIIFDTAPTGHTLRMLQLPSAWSNFISESTHGASCLGQLAGLQDKKDMYKNAVENLADKDKTTLILVSRPEETPLIEAERSSHELSELGINNQVLIINGILSEATDDVSIKMLDKQQKALENMPQGLKKFKIFTIPLRSYNVVGIDNIRTFLYSDEYTKNSIYSKSLNLRHLDVLIEDIYRAGKKVIFTMGKGGVGKTTIAATIAVALARKGVKVHLTSTDPADHLKYVVEDTENIKLSKIDEKKELLRYQNEVLSKARETMSEDDIAYVEEDLRSPCTQEIAVFRAFAEIVDKAENEVVIIDTAPTGHTLLLLDSTQSYHREVQRTKGETPVSVQRLLPRLRDEKQTEVIIVTLPEATPVFEAQRLSDDLNRAGINNKWWVVNQCLSLTNTKNSMLIARADTEKQWLEKVKEISSDNFVGIPWFQDASIESIVNCSGGSKSDE